MQLGFNELIRDDGRIDEDHQFGFDELVAATTEEPAKQGDCAQEWYSTDNGAIGFAHQAADDDGLIVADFDGCVRHAPRYDRDAVGCLAILKIGIGRDFYGDGVVVVDMSPDT